MIWRPVLVLVVVLSACARPDPVPPRPPLPPNAPTACRADVALPDPLRRPRTVEQLGEWARRAALAASATEKARAECARDYQRLRAWVFTPE